MTCGRERFQWRLDVVMTKRMSSLEIVFEVGSKKLLWHILEGEIQGCLSVFGCKDPNYERTSLFLRQIPFASEKFRKFSLHDWKMSYSARLGDVDQHQIVFTVTNRSVETLFLSQISCPERKRVKAKSLRTVSQRNSCRRFIKRSRDESRRARIHKIGFHCVLRWNFHWPNRCFLITLAKMA